MTNLYAAFPELARYAASELRARRLAFGAGMAALAGLCFFIMALGRDNPGKALFDYVLWAQAAVLLGYGTARAASSVMNERQEGTWDLQRLTPLSPEQLAVGKLLGAPLYAFFLAAMLQPWAFLAAALRGAPEPWSWGAAYLSLGSAAFLFLSVGLVVSAYSNEALERGSTATGVLLGILSFQAFTPVILAGGRSQVFSFHGLPLPWPVLWAFTAASLGAWAFLAARWRIGKDLLLGPKWWRLPAFLAFVTWYQLGWSGMSTRLSVLAPAILVYMASILNGVSLDYWRQWLREAKGPEFLHRAPLWIVGVAAFACLAVVATLMPSALGPDAALRPYPLMQALFLVRDLCFLQWMRLGGHRRPEVVGLACLAAAYGFPALVVGMLDVPAWRSVYVPVPYAEAGWLLNLLPGLVQASASGWLLASRIRRGLASAPRVSGE